MKGSFRHGLRGLIRFLVISYNPVFRVIVPISKNIDRLK